MAIEADAKLVDSWALYASAQAGRWCMRMDTMIEHRSEYIEQVDAFDGGEWDSVNNVWQLFRLNDNQHDTVGIRQYDYNWIMLLWLHDRANNAVSFWIHRSQSYKNA